MASISERVWWCSDLPEREDGKKTLEELNVLERSAGAMPDWAVSVAENNIAYFPPCGHEMFAHNVDATLEAIKEHRAVEGFSYCFMVSDEALAKARDVVEKCDLRSASIPAAGVLANRLRWWETVNAEIKDNPFTSDGARNDCYEWDEKTRKAIEDAGLSPDDELVKRIKSTWLCAPKAFRFIEKIGEEIGVDLRGYDAYDGNTFRNAITGAMERIEAALPDAEARDDRVAVFLLALLRAKLSEYVRNGLLKKVMKT